jgi:acyl-coenzyme A thioesterase PaaI-like protein
MPKTPTFALWHKLAAKPGGKQLFSAAICLRVPYFRTVLPSVRELRPGHCEVTAPKWWGVYNHIRTFHAIAACNLAEIAMGMLAEATVPTTHRWLPKGMNVQYVAKAETGLRAVAALPELPEFGDEGFDLEVPVTISDAHDRPVVTGTITVWVTPKKR